MILYLPHIKRLQLQQLLLSYQFKRFTGSKPITGHAGKIMEILNKTPSKSFTSTGLAQSSTHIPQDTPPIVKDVPFTEMRLNTVNNQTFSTINHSLSSSSQQFPLLSSPSSLTTLGTKPNKHEMVTRSYATNRVYTPTPTTSSREGLNNNPAIPFVRKAKRSVIVQHPEWVQDICDKPGCNSKMCIGLCSKKISTRSIAHFTHSDDDKHSPQKLADTDLDGNTSPIYVKSYENPHETTGQSYNPEKDEQRTTTLNGYIYNINNDNNKKDN